MLGQLIVTPEVELSKISTMKENGISPKIGILAESVAQISIPLAHVINMSLVTPFLYEKGSRNESVDYRPVSLT